MFAVSDASVALGGKPILRGINFRVEPGERVAIVGPNGAGKTTILRLMAGNLRPDEGEVLIPGRKVLGYLAQDVEFGQVDRPLREEVESVFEPVHAAEAEMRRLEHRMAEITDHETPEFQDIAHRYDHLQHEVHRLEGHSIEGRVARILTGLGFKQWQLERPLAEMSGGWQMRAMLAKLLLIEPDLLLLDEPTNHLDLESMLWLENWIRESKTAVVMVSHERAFMDRLCHRIFELHLGQVTIFKGNYSQYLVDRDHRHEVQRRAFENQQREVAQTERFIERFRAKSTKAAQVQSRIKQLEKMERLEPPPSDPRTIHFRFPPPTRAGKEVIRLQGVGHAFGNNRVFSGVDLTIYRGDKIALVGVNGAGKTTLLRVIAGKLRPTEGEREVSSTTQMDHFTQGQWDTLHPEQTVLQSMRAAASLEGEQNLRNCLGAFCFSGADVDKPVSVLSGGEKTRLRLGMMLFNQSNFLLLDEPTNHLDVWSRITLEEALRRWEGTLLVVSHDRYFLDRVTNKVVEIRDSDVHQYPGKYSDYLKRLESESGGEPEKAAPQVTARATPKLESAKSTKRAEADQALLSQIQSVQPRYQSRKSKEDRRREAEERNRRGKQLRPLQKKVKKIEDKIQLHEIRINAINTELSKPDAYDNQESVTALMKERGTLTKEVEALTQEWEAASLEIEELDPKSK